MKTIHTGINDVAVFLGLIGFDFTKLAKHFIYLVKMYLFQHNHFPCIFLKQYRVSLNNFQYVIVSG